LEHVFYAVGVGYGDTRRDGTGGRGVFGMDRRGGLATSCVSYCNYAVKAASIVLMLFLETFCLSVSL